MFECTICDKSFTVKSNLTRHIQTHVNDDRVKKYTCSVCNYTTSRPDNIKRHNDTMHVPSHVSMDSIKADITCVLCKSYCCVSRKDMVQHYASEHDIAVQREELSFEDEKQFEEWKLSVEKRDYNQFTRNTGVKTSADGVRKLTYSCFRDGSFKTRGVGARQEKILGSNKINGCCPSKIVARFLPTGRVNVDYVKTHVGHTNDLGRMKLSKNEREEVAKNIASNVKLPKILDSVRDSIAFTELERGDLLTLKDIHNIARDYFLEAEGVRDKNDSTSVHSWVSEMQETDGNTIVFYKSQGTLSEKFPQLKKEDFVLILMNDSQLDVLKKFGERCVCADSTHGMNPYGFDLTTVLTLDDLHEGFPTTFMFSNRTDTEMLTVMFSTIKESLGHALVTDVFMSDMADEFYNAWTAVMGPPKHRLFCAWHVDRAWRKN